MATREQIRHAKTKRATEECTRTEAQRKRYGAIAMEANAEIEMQNAIAIAKITALANERLAATIDPAEIRGVLATPMIPIRAPTTAIPAACRTLGPNLIPARLGPAKIEPKVAVLKPEYKPASARTATSDFKRIRKSRVEVISIARSDGTDEMSRWVLTLVCGHTVTRSILTPKNVGPKMADCPSCMKSKAT